MTLRIAWRKHGQLFFAHPRPFGFSIGLPWVAKLELTVIHMGAQGPNDVAPLRFPIILPKDPIQAWVAGCTAVGCDADEWPLGTERI